MTSDDVTAVAAISFGTVASVAVTMLLLAPEPDVRRNVMVERVETVRVVPSTNVVDFAIIRSEPGVEIMVGPEGPKTGWSPEQSIEIRKLRAR
jgi:hypothetical protein